MSSPGSSPLPTAVDLVVEVPLGGFVKRRINGGIDYVSPLPSPFNYGCVPDLPAADGHPLDVVLLGPRQPVGHRTTASVHGVVRFVDAGQTDDKLVCSHSPPTRLQRTTVHLFFAGYGRAKRWLNAARGLGGPTALTAVNWNGR